MPNVQTIKDAEVVASANGVRDANQIVNVTAENLKKLKTVLVNHLLDDYSASVTDGDGITNFKINCESDGNEDGVVIQVQMRVGTSEVTDPEELGKLTALLGDNATSLFEEREIFKEITDLDKLLKSINHEVVAKKSKIDAKGEITIKVGENMKGLEGVTTRKATFPKASFLDKARKLKLEPEAAQAVAEFVQTITTPTVIVGNKPESKS
jgi:hypothetical protein